VTRKPAGTVLTGISRDEAARIRIAAAMREAQRQLEAGRYGRYRLVLDTLPPAAVRRARRGDWYCIGKLTDLHIQEHVHVWWQPHTEPVHIERHAGIRCRRNRRRPTDAVGQPEAR
jgi:hypothetical protein